MANITKVTKSTTYTVTLSEEEMILIRNLTQNTYMYPLAEDGRATEPPSKMVTREEIFDVFNTILLSPAI